MQGGGRAAAGRRQGDASSAAGLFPENQADSFISFDSNLSPSGVSAEHLLFWTHTQLIGVLTESRHGPHDAGDVVTPQSDGRKGSRHGTCAL